MKKLFLILIACAGLTACDKVPSAPDIMGFDCLVVSTNGGIGQTVYKCVDDWSVCYITDRGGIDCRAL